MKPESMDRVFHALSSPLRRKMLDIVQALPGCSVNDVAKYFKISRIAVMKHLAVLETAQLIVSKKPGRTRELYFNAAPIQMIYDRWTTEYSRFWASQATDLKYLAETAAAEKAAREKRSVPRKAPKQKKPSRKTRRSKHESSDS